MTARLMILNGPNLNLLGVREPHIYGSTTLAAVKKSCEEFAAFAGAQLSFHQSNHEGELVDLIQSAREQADALIVNPATTARIVANAIEEMKAKKTLPARAWASSGALMFVPPCPLM